MVPPMSTSRPAAFAAAPMVIGAWLASAGCGPSSAHPIFPDAGGAAMDLAVAADLAPPGLRVGFVVDQLFLPRQKGDYANDPAVLEPPPVVTLRIVLAASIPIDLPLVVVRLSFPAAAAGSRVQLDGALTKADVALRLVPALSRALTAIAQRSPCDADCTQ